MYLWESIPWTASGEVPDEFVLQPDIAVEIASPGQIRPRLRRRCHWYVQHGVRFGLPVDPDDRSITVFRPGRGAERLQGTDAIDCGDVLPGLTLVVDEVFAALRGR